MVSIIQKADGGRTLFMKHPKFHLHYFVLPVAALLSLAAVFYLDISMRTWVLDIQNQYPIIRSIASAFTLLGYNSYIFLALIPILIERLKYDTPDNPLSKFSYHSFMFLVSTLIAGGITHTIKFIVGRYRPSSDLFTFEPFSGHISFPSGHSQAIFSIVMYICLTMKGKRPLKALLIFLAIIVSCTRVVLNRHFVSDIIMGAAIGGYVSFLIVIKFAHGKKIYSSILPDELRKTKKK